MEWLARAWTVHSNSHFYSLLFVRYSSPRRCVAWRRAAADSTRLVVVVLACSVLAIGRIETRVLESRESRLRRGKTAGANGRRCGDRPTKKRKRAKEPVEEVRRVLMARGGKSLEPLFLSLFLRCTQNLRAADCSEQCEKASALRARDNLPFRPAPSTPFHSLPFPSLPFPSLRLLSLCFATLPFSSFALPLSCVHTMALAFSLVVLLDAGFHALRYFCFAEKRATWHRNCRKMKQAISSIVYQSSIESKKVWSQFWDAFKIISWPL